MSEVIFKLGNIAVTLNNFRWSQKGGVNAFETAIKVPDEIADRIWKKVLKGDDRLFISTITINEFLTYAYRRGKSKEGKTFVEGLKTIINISIIPVTTEIAEKSAGYRHGLGMHTTDSIILATFVLKECDKIYTTDRGFQTAKDNEIGNITIWK